MSKIQEAHKLISEKGSALLDKLKSAQRDLAEYNQSVKNIAAAIKERAQKEAEEAEKKAQEELYKQQLEQARAEEKRIEEEKKAQAESSKHSPDAVKAENESASVEPDKKSSLEASEAKPQEKEEISNNNVQPDEKPQESSAKVTIEAKAEETAPSMPQQNQNKIQNRQDNRPAGQNKPQYNQQGNRTQSQDRPQGQYSQQGGRPQNQGRPQGQYNQQGNRAQGQDRPQGQYSQQGGRPQNQGRPQGQYNQQGNRAQGQDRPQGQFGQQNRTAGPGRAQGAGTVQRRTGQEALPVMEKGKVSNYDPNKSSYRKNAQDKENAVKRGIKTTIIEDDDRMGSRKRGSKKLAKTKIEPIVIEHAVISGNTVSVKELSEKLGKPAAAIIKELLKLDILATINQEIDFETAELVALEFNITLEQKLEKSFEEKMIDSDMEDSDDKSLLEERPPVVTIMGHVDHGKTSLLDAIRSANITKQEAGGITQHIGAYTVEVGGKTITFIDTPGHEAFTSMRARGAQVTDVSILVVAADDGIMPQTVEAINHSKAAGVPIIVAINKMDKPSANPDRIMQQLTEYELLPEAWGGDTVVVPVSAHTKEGLDTLLEMILLVAEMRELKANPNHRARGTIIEAQLDKGRGPVATVLIQNGTLHIGDTVVAGTAYGRVRAMMDHMGQRVEEAGPSMPVEVLGFSEVPSAGDLMYAVEDDKLSRQVVEERKDIQKAQQLKAMSKVSLDELFDKIAEGDIKTLNIIVKADVQGSVEAVKQSLEKISNEEVRVSAIHGGVGAITESDIMLASASNAIVIGFNVRPDPMARAAAEAEKVDVRLYRIIYNAIEDIELAIKGMLKPTYVEVVTGHAEVRNTFKISSVGTVAGCYVTDGKIGRSSKARVNRDNIVVYDGSIDSLKRFKDDAKEVVEGFECGITLVNFNDIKDGDIIEAYVMEEVKR